MDLRKERLDRGLSREQLASEIDVSERVIEAAENGARPRPANAFKIASYFGAKVTELWPLEAEPVEGAA